MTTVVKNSKINEDLLKEFYEAFNIKPKARRALKSYGFPEPEIDLFLEYPEITDTKILELLIICNKHNIFTKSIVDTVNEFKENLLKTCIEVTVRNSIYNDVRALFGC